ncbi:hypothetical protein [Castellaniella sp.]|uniref:hypothetical protein n=1 Tax=Castellaniella sp. TaxID=1955812 RepID=UPI002AFE680D|nr:hypothetical protein [Castellaniella sp.]
MKKLPYLPEGYEGQLTEAQRKFAQIAVETQIRLRRRGLAVFRDRGRFCRHMFGLAKEYQYRQLRQSEQDDARAKFARISARSQQLAAVLAELAPKEIRTLGEQMTLKWTHASVSEKEDREDRLCSGDWPFQALPLTIQTYSLGELEKASAKLSRASRSGRAKLHAEHWAARGLSGFAMRRDGLRFGWPMAAMR